MRAGRTFPRSLSLCAAALVLLQLGGLVHLAAAPHGICWEHGVVVELDTAAPGTKGLPARDGLGHAAPLVRSEHPHCPALSLLRPLRLESGSATPVLACSQHPAMVAVRQDVPPRAGWALQRAPKQSPPV
jgi:hypothetical protein